MFCRLTSLLSVDVRRIIGRETERVPDRVLILESHCDTGTQSKLSRRSDCKLTLVLTDRGRISQAKAIKISQNAQCTYCMFGPSDNPIKNSFVAMSVHLCMVTGCCSCTYICIPTVAKSLYAYIYIYIDIYFISISFANITSKAPSLVLGRW